MICSHLIDFLAWHRSEAVSCIENFQQHQHCLLPATMPTFFDPLLSKSKSQAVYWILDPKSEDRGDGNVAKKVTKEL